MAKRVRITPGVWIGAVFGVAIVLTGVAVFTGFGRPTTAPDDRGVCWRVTAYEPKLKYVRLAKDVANLETCAAHLERLFIQAGGEVAGAYQGRFIFIDSKAIRSATALESARWNIFMGPQRAVLDQQLRQGGKTPQMFMMPVR